MCICIPRMISAQLVIDWAKNIGGTDSENIFEILEIENEGYFLVGITSSMDNVFSNNHGSRDGFLIKIDYEGNILWNKTIGGSNIDNLNSIEKSDDGGYFLAGSTNSIDGDISDPTIINETALSGWMLKINGEGQILWDKKYFAEVGSLFRKIKKDDNGDLIVVGTVNSQIRIYKLDTEGNEIWAEYLEETSNTIFGDFIVNSMNEIILLNSVVVDEDTDEYDIKVTKIDTNGEELWTKTIGGSQSDFGLKIIEISSGEYLLGGSTLSDDGDIGVNNGGGDVLLIKINDEGEINWKRVIGGDSHEIITGIEKYEGGKFLIAGQTISANGELSSEYGGRDAFIGEINQEGSLNWVRYFGGSGTEQFVNIYSSHDSSLILALSSTSVDENIMNNNGGFDLWVSRLTNEITRTYGVNGGNFKIRIGPNPVENQLMVEYLGEKDLSLQMNLINIYGQVLWQNYIDRVEIVDVHKFPAGVMLCEIIVDGKIKVIKRLIKK